METRTPVYLILGHGEESVTEVEERKTVPEGCTVVTVAECGNVSYMEEVCSSTALFSNPANGPMLEEPGRHRAELAAALGKRIHVHRPGGRLPSLTISPFAYWRVGFYGYQIARSGVFSFPMKPNPIFADPFAFATETDKKRFLKNKDVKGILETCKGNILYMSKDKLTDDLYPKIYTDVLIPSKSQQRPTGPPHTFAEQSKLSLETLLQTLGPGIYYYVICRADNTYYSGGPRNIPFMLHALNSSPNDPAVKKFKETVEETRRYIYEPRNSREQIARYVERMSEFPEGIPGYDALPRNFKEELAQMDIYPPANVAKQLRNYSERLGRIRRASNAGQNAGARRTRGTRRQR